MKKNRYRLMLGLFVYFSVFNAIGSESLKSNSEVVVNDNGWFLIEALGCMFPIPNKYILQTKGSQYVFSEASKNGLLAGAGHIKVIEYADDDRSNLVGQEFTFIKKEGDFVYEHLKQKDKDIGYIFHKDAQAILVSHVNKDLQKKMANTMFEYCKTHPIE